MTRRRLVGTPELAERSRPMHERPDDIRQLACASRPAPRQLPPHIGQGSKATRHARSDRTRRPDPAGSIATRDRTGPGALAADRREFNAYPKHHWANAEFGLSAVATSCSAMRFSVLADSMNARPIALCASEVARIAFHRPRGARQQLGTLATAGSVASPWMICQNAADGKCRMRRRKRRIEFQRITKQRACHGRNPRGSVATDATCRADTVPRRRGFPAAFAAPGHARRH